MEAVPAHVDLERLQATLEGVPGTVEVHDLHVWSLTTGHCALSAHAVVDGSVPGDDILARMAAACARDFHIHHVTVQLEHRSRRAEEPVH
jgi:cobalt-zinc-cadmium efflux system protein